MSYISHRNENLRLKVQLTNMQQLYDNEVNLRMSVEAQLSETKALLSYASLKLDNPSNDVIVDNCWIKAQLGECAKYAYEKSAEDLNTVLNGVDYMLVSSVVDALYFTGAELQTVLNSYMNSLNQILCEESMEEATDSLYSAGKLVGDSLYNATSDITTTLVEATVALGNQMQNMTEDGIRELQEGLQCIGTFLGDLFSTV